MFMFHFFESVWYCKDDLNKQKQKLTKQQAGYYPLSFYSHPGKRNLSRVAFKIKYKLYLYNLY